MRKKLKKAIILLFSNGLLLSCSSNLSSVMALDETSINTYLNATQITMNETLIVDDKEITVKNSYFDYTSSFTYYASISNKDSTYYKSKNIESYALNSTYLYEVGSSKYTYACDSSNIFSFDGLKAILEDKKSSGSKDISDVLPIARDIYYDLGYFVDYEDFIGDFSLTYNVSFYNDLLLVEVDATDILKKLFPLIGTARKKYIISIGVDENSLKAYPQEETNTKVTDEELKAYSSSYIKEVYDKLEYVCNDLKFISYCPKSRRLTYSYTTSNESILTSDGKFTSPSQDTNMTLTIALKLDDEVFENQEFSFIAHAPVIRSGELGSQENPLYQGRKAIDKVEIYFIEMHKQYGDSIYIKAGDFDMLIDAGSSSDGYYVSKMLQENMVDSSLDMVIATHAHSDHIGGMKSALDSCTSIGYALDYGYTRSSYSVSNEVRTLMKSKCSKYNAVSDALNENNGIIYISDDFYITILDTNQYLSQGEEIGDGDDNDASVTILLTYKNHSYYFSGDLNSAGESYIVSTSQVGKVNLMKASHHGSVTGNSTKLLSTIKPDVVAISTALVDRGSTSSDAQGQVHPSKQALNNYSSVNADVYCNFTMGTIHVTSLGSGNLTVEGLGLTSPYYMNGKAVIGEENKLFNQTQWYKCFR